MRLGLSFNSPACHPRRAHRVSSGALSGFTLIELLVTIAIIAILAALIFPMFSALKGSGDSAKCVSNLRQISVAATSYSAEHDGDLVPLSAPNWAAFVGKGIPADEGLNPYLNSNDVLLCPGDRRLKTGIFDYQGTSYNVNLVSYFSKGAYITGRSPIKMASINNPSSLILFAECLAYDGTALNKDPSSKPDWGASSWHWGKKSYRINGATATGSVVSFVLQQTPNQSIFFGSWADVDKQYRWVS